MQMRKTPNLGSEAAVDLRGIAGTRQQLTKRPHAGHQMVGSRVGVARSPAPLLLPDTGSAGGSQGGMAGCQEQPFRRVKKQAQLEEAVH
ncbi:unnamed protein product [Arctogadus glacialis]